MPSEEQSKQSRETENAAGKGISRLTDFELLAKNAAAQGDWQAAAKWYARAVEQHSAQFALINSVQEGLSSKLEMQAIYDLVGDRLRDTFNAQVVMISQYDPLTHKVFHHYAIEQGQHLQISGWHPIDSSREQVVCTGRPLMINLEEILRLVAAEKMRVIPGTQLPHTWLGVPMLVGDQVIGVVSLQNLDIENAFSASDIDLLTTLTNSMSASLENARLFSETQRLLALMEAEMTLARQTQRSILPAQLPHHPGYEFGALMMPARAVGGDFFDFVPLNRKKVCVLIGDASDKGLPAALFMAMTFILLHAEMSRSHSPRQVLRNVNRHLTHLKESKVFVTVLFCVLDFETGEITYSRAGHLPPVLVDDTGRAVEITMDRGQPLGMIEDIQIDEQRCQIPPGGLVLLHSDGLNEASNPDGSEFGLHRVRELLAARRGASAQAICDTLWQAASAHCGEALHQDDFTALVIKRAG